MGFGTLSSVSTEKEFSSMASDYSEPFSETLNSVVQDPYWTAGLGSTFHSAYRGYKEARANGRSVMGSLDNFALGGISGMTRIALTGVLAGTVGLSAGVGVAGGVAINEGFNVMTKAREENMRLERMKTSELVGLNKTREKVRESFKNIVSRGSEELGEKIFPREDFGGGEVSPGVIESKRSKEQYLASEGVKKFIKAIRITQSKGQIPVPILNSDGTPQLDTEGKVVKELPYKKLRDSLSAYIPGYDQDDIHETDPQGIIENVLRKAVNTEGGLLAGKSKKEVLEAIEEFGKNIHVYDDVNTLLSKQSKPATTAHAALTEYVLFSDDKNAPLLKDTLLYAETNEDGTISYPIVDKLAEIADRHNPVSPSASTRPREEGEILHDLNIKKSTLLSDLGGIVVSNATTNAKKSEILRKINDLNTITSLSLYDSKLSDVYSINPLPTHISKPSNEIIAEMDVLASDMKNDINKFSYGPSIKSNTKAFKNLKKEKSRLITAIDAAFSPGISVSQYESNLLSISTTHSDLLPILSPFSSSIRGISRDTVDREAQELNNFITSFSGEMGSIDRFERGSSSPSSLESIKTSIKRDPFAFIKGLPAVAPDYLQSKIFNSFLLSGEGIQFKQLLEEKLEKEGFADTSSLNPAHGKYRAFNEKHDTALGGKKYGVQGVIQYTGNQLKTLFSGKIKEKDDDGNIVENDVGGMGRLGSIVNIGSSLLAGKELVDMIGKLRK